MSINMERNVTITCHNAIKWNTNMNNYFPNGVIRLSKPLITIVRSYVLISEIVYISLWSNLLLRKSFTFGM